jgi:hypothetical protein
MTFIFQLKPTDFGLCTVNVEDLRNGKKAFLEKAKYSAIFQPNGIALTEKIVHSTNENIWFVDRAKLISALTKQGFDSDSIKRLIDNSENIINKYFPLARHNKD